MLRWTVHLKGGPKRSFYAAVAVGSKLYSFGGYFYEGDFSDSDLGLIAVHVFNTVSLRWTRLLPVTTGGGGRPLDVPSMRDGHTAVLIEDAIYIWGGITCTLSYCNVLYALDVSTHGWCRPMVHGTVPEATCGHSACVLGKFMYIFGGLIPLTRWTNDIHKLDTTTMFWSLLHTTGVPAPASSCHSATVVGTRMFVFGGDAQDGIFYNITVFDTETKHWLSTPSGQLVPKGRRGHSAFVYNGELYIFGGHDFDEDQSFNDVWKFNPGNISWKKVDPKGKGPFPLLDSCMSGMCCCMVGDRIFLFGGHRFKPDDLYILDLSPSLKTLCKMAVIRYSLDQSGLPHDIRWEMSVCQQSDKKDDNCRLKVRLGNRPDRRERVEERRIDRCPYRAHLRSERRE